MFRFEFGRVTGEFVAEVRVLGGSKRECWLQSVRL